MASTVGSCLCILLGGERVSIVGEWVCHERVCVTRGCVSREGVCHERVSVTRGCVMASTVGSCLCILLKYSR